MEYSEEDYLDLAGIQHFCFCRRQWALIHLEGLWKENFLTMDGHIFHENAHEGKAFEKRGDVLISRGMRVSSPSLGVTGICDVVEFHQSSQGVPLIGRKGTWLPIPVEYKRGKPKESDADRLQLCCQAMCLEEMLCCPPIQKAYLYYGEPARRTAVALTEELRSLVCSIAAEMHQLTQKQHTPRVRPGKSCQACSLKDLCLPKLQKISSPSAYVEKRLDVLMEGE